MGLIDQAKTDRVKKDQKKASRVYAGWPMHSAKLNPQARLLATVALI